MCSVFTFNAVDTGRDVLPHELSLDSSNLRKSLKDEKAVSVKYYDWLTDSALKPIPNHDVLASLSGEPLDFFVARDLFAPSHEVFMAVHDILKAAPPGLPIIGVHARGVTDNTAVPEFEQQTFQFSATRHKAFANCALKFAHKLG